MKYLKTRYISFHPRTLGRYTNAALLLFFKCPREYKARGLKSRS